MHKVLLLEEDAMYAQDLLRGLTAAGCSVTLARDGDAGLTRATTEPFDVLVVSAELPVINGFRLCAKLKKDPAWGTPVVLMGSDRTVGFDEHRKLPSRAQGYLRKPVSIEELVALLDQVRRAPTGKTIAPPRPPPRTIRPAAALKSALDSAHEQGAIVQELRKQLAAHEQTIGRLTRELEGARARSVPPPSGGPQTAHEQLGLRQQLVQKDRELAEAKAAHAAAVHERMDVERARAALEAKVRELEGERRDRDARVAKAEKLALAARADKEQAAKRADDFGRAAERHRADLEQARAQLAAAEDDLERTRAELSRERARADGLARTHAEDRSAAERVRAEAEQASTAEIERLRARTEELRRALEEAEARAMAARDEGDAALEREREARIAEVAELLEKLDRATSADREAFEKRVEDETRRGRELDEVRAASTAIKDQHAREARGLRARIEELEARAAEQAREANAQRDRAAEDLTRAEERYVRSMTASLEEQRAKLAAAAAELTTARERAKADAEQARAAHVAALAEAERRAAAHAEAKVREELSKQVSELETRIWAEAEEASTSKTQVLEARVADQQADVMQRVTALEAQAAELSLALEKSRRTLDAERRQHLEETAEHSEELDAVERELAELRAQVGRLEAELAETRKTHAHEAAAARAALEQLERDRTLIDQAKTLLAEIVSREDE